MRYLLFVMNAAICLAMGAAASAQELRVPAIVKWIDEADVPALEAGVLATMSVQEGDKVEAGQLLVKLHDREAQLLRERQKAEYEIAHKQAEDLTKLHSSEAALKVAEAELKRAQDARMRIGDSVSDAEVDRLELTVTQAKLAIGQAKHEVEVAVLQANFKLSELAIAQEKLERHAISAPFAGVVAQVFNRRGEWVEPGEKVLRLVRTDRLKAEGFAPSEKIKPSHAGSRVILTPTGAADGIAFQGTLTFVSPETDPINGQVRVVAEFDNAKGALRPGVKGTLAILGK